MLDPIIVSKERTSHKLGHSSRKVASAALFIIKNRSCYNLPLEVPGLPAIAGWGGGGGS